MNNMWIDVYERLPNEGNAIQVQISDTPDGDTGHFIGSIPNVVATPSLGDEWPIPTPNGDGWVRYWRLVQ